jgi:TrmH family RNA methyltransferase
MTAPPTLLTSRANPRVKQLRAAFAGNARLAGGLIAIEGQHLLQEALRSGLVFKTIFLSENYEVSGLLPRGVEIMRLAEDVFASAVDTQQPQGTAALLIPPVWKIEDAFRLPTVPLLLIAAGLQYPGNLGTLIRSAEAFGGTAVLTTPGTVSEWNQKAVRASAGSVFRVPVIATTTAEIASLKSRSLRIFAAIAPNSESGPENPKTENVAIAAATTNLEAPCALMIGNEGAGLSQELLALADARLTIPIPGRVESLNAAVAGSLLLYEASRQRAQALNQRPTANNHQPSL